MSKVKTFAVFLLGAAIGGAGTWYFTKELYAKRSEQDISSAKEAFHSREEKLQAEINELKKNMESGTPVETTPTVLEPGKFPEKGDITEYARGKYTQYGPQIHQAKPEVTEPAPGPGVEAPYVISPDEFGEMDGYTQVSLTLYADGILADEYGVIIDDIEEIVGDALSHFGEYEDDSVYCRSDPKRSDYEILKDLRRYADVRKSFPSNI